MITDVAGFIACDCAADRRPRALHVSNLAGRPVLGRLAQRVAERAEGWVLVEFQAPRSADLLGYLENAGRCIRVDDYVYLDAPAMAAWYAHPNFHVIK